MSLLRLPSVRKVGVANLDAPSCGFAIRTPPSPTNTSLMLAILGEQTTPTIVEELSDTLMYVGYCLPTTTSYDDPTWLIRLVKKTINEDGSSVQTIMYPNGERRYNQKWTDREHLFYGHTKMCP